MNRWKVGNATITRVVENEWFSDASFVMPKATLPNVAKESWVVRGRLATPEGHLGASIHSYVVESRGCRILIDTCVGNDKQRTFPGWDRLSTSFLDDLANAGYARETIDVVLCTHLHADHIGWNTMLVDGRWVPTFPNADYVICGREWSFFSAVERSELRAPVEDSLRPVMNAGKARLVEANYRINDEVWLESTPGHTPGHVSVGLSSCGERAVITGDVMYHPIQCAHPEWASVADTDPELARNTRRAFCENYADRPVIVFGTHFPTPSAGRIVSAGDTWHFEDL